MRIGYLGVGSMGGALARRLQVTHKISVYDLNLTASQPFAESGAVVCRTARELAQSSDVVFTCLQTSDQVRQAIFGDAGLLGGLKSGSYIVDQTTGDAHATRAMAAELAPRGIHLVDAPVSGGPQWAEAGTIAIMAGASDQQFEVIAPILRSISPNVMHCGNVGTGHVAKVCNNLMAASQRLLAFEVVALAARNGLAPAKAIEVMTKGSGRNYTVEVTFPRHILSGDLVQGFTLGLMLKDVKLAGQLASGSQTPLFLGGLVQEYYKSIVNTLGADQDVNHAVTIFERQAGVEICAPPKVANSA